MLLLLLLSGALGQLCLGVLLVRFEEGMDLWIAFLDLCW